MQYPKPKNSSKNGSSVAYEVKMKKTARSRNKIKQR
jgi:hypothetical protein